MSIERLFKVSLCGHRDDKEPVLADLQRLGLLHLVSLADTPREPERAPPRYPEDCYQALRYLNDTPRKLRQIRRNPKFALDETVGEILQNRQKNRIATDRRDFLTERCKALEPWGDFRLPQAPDLAGYKLWFYILPVNQRAALGELDLVWQIVHQDNLNLYVTVVARDEPGTDALPVPRTHTGAVPLSELREALTDVEIELETLAVEREALTRWIFLLTQNLARAEDETALVHATTQTLDDERVFAVQGWVATRDVAAIETFANEHELAFLVEEPAAAESPPTLLRNARRIEGGEDLVKFYETPGYRTWDPSGVVFFSFALFFAMILGDAGYALVVAGIVAAYWKRMGESDTGRRLRGVFATVAAASIGYGMLVGSYFGVTPPEDSFLARFHVLDLNDFGSMMRISIVIGCTHLVMANVAQAWHAWSLSARIAPLAWSAVILGGLALWFSSTGVGPPQTMKTGGIALMGAGLLAVLLFASQREVRSAGDAAKRLLDGLVALTNLTKIFGDVLSYMRLFALGLASASLALTFNKLAHDAGAALEGPGLLVQILILVVGHALNLVLALMSGVVHGLRLNVIEFFNWGLTEEGYPFQPFAKKEIEQ